MRREIIAPIGILLMLVVAVGGSQHGLEYPGANVVRIASALLVVLVLPGSAIVAALFPAGELDLASRVLFGLGVSMVVTILGGLILTWLALNLDAGTWMLWLAGLTLVAGTVALFRGVRSGAEPLAEVGGHADGVVSEKLTPRHIALFAVAAVIVLGAVVLGRGSEATQSRPGFTQLWCTTDKDDVATVHLGVANREGKPVSFHLRLKQGEIITHDWPRIELADRATWTMTALLDPSRSGDVRADLYRLDAPENAYRQVILSREK